MTRANIHDIKAHFSNYVKRAKAGEVIVVCERNVPVAELRALASEEEIQRREIGFLKHMIVRMDDDAFAPMADEEVAAVDNAPLIDGTEN